MVLKSGHLLTHSQRTLKAYGHVIDESNPYSWRYYKELFGEYYVPNGAPLLEGDDYGPGYHVPMYVTALENGSRILFSKANLVNYPTTRTEYLKREEFYNRLVEQYPDQYDLIRSTLEPLGVTNEERDWIISCKDYTILRYDKTFVGITEDNLIEKLQDWLYHYTDRFNIKAFTLSDAYYPAAYLAVLYPAIVSQIVTIREQNVHTVNASKYHIWSYLGNYYDIDEFRETIPLNYAAWLYMNIDRFKAFAGTTNTLDEMIGIFSDFSGISANNLDVYKDDSELIDGLRHKNRIVAYPYGSDMRLDKTATIKVNRDAITSLRNQAVDNREQELLKIDEMDNLGSKLLSSVVTTPIVELSSPRQRSNDLINILVERMNWWIYLAAQQDVDTGENIANLQFLINVEFKSDVIRKLNAAEAVAVFLYCAGLYQGVIDPEVNGPLPIPELTLREIPKRFNSEQERHDSFFYGVPEGVISEAAYTALVSGFDNIVFPDDYITSPQEFNDYVAKVIDYKVMQILSASLMNNSTYRTIWLNAISNLYGIRRVKLLLSHADYRTLFTALSVDINLIDKINAPKIAHSIANQIIGNFDSGEGLQSPHFEMMQIIRRLAHNATIFVPSVSSSMANAVLWDNLYVEQVNKEMKYGIGEIKLFYPEFEYALKSAEYSTTDVKMLDVSSNTSLTVTGEARLGVDIEHTSGTNRNFIIPLGGLGVDGDGMLIDIRNPIKHNLMVDIWFMDDVPPGYVEMDGSILPIAGNENLHQVLGGKFGSTSTHFTIPDMRGRTFESILTTALDPRVGEYGMDTLPHHNHTYTGYGQRLFGAGRPRSGNSPSQRMGGEYQTQAGGGSDTRMSNIYCKFIMSLDPQNIYDSRPIGSLSFSFGRYLPANILVCDGSLRPIAEYDELFAAIGNTYTLPSDPADMFRLPNMNELYVRIVDEGNGVDEYANSRLDRGDGVSGDNVGTTQPMAFVAHTHAQIEATFTSANSIAGSPSFLTVVNSNTSGNVVNFSQDDATYGVSQGWRFSDKVRMKHMKAIPVIVYRTLTEEDLVL